MAEIKIFDKEPKPQKWFDFDEDTEILVEYTEKEDLDEIRAQAARQSRMTLRENIDVIANGLLGQRKVKGWRKKDDPAQPGLIVNGQPFPYSEKNAAYLMRKSLDFSNFVNEICLKISQFAEEERAVEIKNS